jgi:hypothetical protein
LESKEKRIDELTALICGMRNDGKCSADGLECTYDCIFRKYAERVWDDGWRKSRKGRWIATPPSYCSCSECKTEGSPRWKCCPVCMAVMEVDV